MRFAKKRRRKGESTRATYVACRPASDRVAWWWIRPFAGLGYYGWSPLGLLILIVLILALTGNLNF
jgi:hypothetical protein